MPKYNFICPNCNHEMEKYYSIKDYCHPLCEKCGHPTQRDFSVIRVNAHVEGSMTLGSLADSNRKKMGDELAAIKAKEYNDYKAPHKTPDDYIKADKQPRKPNRKGRKSNGRKK